MLLRSAGNFCARGLASRAFCLIRRSNPLAWPLIASGDDVRHFRPTVIQVNECDCLRDDGVALYHLLLPAGVKTWCGELLGMEHATENGAVLCPEVSRDAARDIAALAKGE